ncbi:MAG: sodium:solute symporter family protein [Bacteroidetes bacterium]|nr:MAG: sodium:solute symporter family protein [Bacteroidota bacterium]
MIQTLLIVGIIYVAALVFFSLRARKTAVQGSKGYLFAGANLGAVLGLFTFAATLFSTFTLLGMPDFFRQHGIGAWIFLAVADMMMVFGIIWVGHQLRKKAQQKGFNGMAGLMSHCFRSPLAGYITFGGAFIFLIPYVAIQIRGVAIFFDGAFPHTLPIWAWALIMVGVMLLYSETGGLKAIIYSDTLQGILLLLAIWLIGANCLGELGGLEAMFQEVGKVNEALLSTPGPKGLFTFQFFLATFIAIGTIPYTQPQVSTRLIIMKDQRALKRMAVGMGAFAILVILPTLFVGMYGAVLYPDLSTQDFLSKALVQDQPQLLAAVVIIGLFAAAISTADSQIFALGSELRSLLKGEDRRLLTVAKVAIFIFAMLAYIFSLFSSDELVMLARTSFAGTSLMAPMIFAAIYTSSPPARWLLWATLVAQLLFIGSLLGWVPNHLGALRLDLALFTALAAIAVLASRAQSGKQQDTPAQVQKAEEAD